MGFKILDLRVGECFHIGKSDIIYDTKEEAEKELNKTIKAIRDFNDTIKDEDRPSYFSLDPLDYEFITFSWCKQNPIREFYEIIKVENEQ